MPHLRNKFKTSFPVVKPLKETEAENTVFSQLLAKSSLEQPTPAQLQAERRRGVKTLFAYKPTLNAALTAVPSPAADIDHYKLSVRLGKKAADAYSIYVFDDKIIIQHPASKVTLFDKELEAIKHFKEWLTGKKLSLPLTDSEANGSKLQPRVPTTILKF